MGAATGMVEPVMVVVKVVVAKVVAVVGRGRGAPPTAGEWVTWHTLQRNKRRAIT